MYPDAMTLFGRALLVYFEGGTETELILRRDDGQETPVPVSLFFRDPSQFSPIEAAALEECRGTCYSIHSTCGVLKTGPTLPTTRATVKQGGTLSRSGYRLSLEGRRDSTSVG